MITHRRLHKIRPTLGVRPHEERRVKKPEKDEVYRELKEFENNYENGKLPGPVMHFIERSGGISNAIKRAVQAKSRFLAMPSSRSVSKFAAVSAIAAGAVIALGSVASAAAYDLLGTIPLASDFDYVDGDMDSAYFSWIEGVGGDYKLYASMGATEKQLVTDDDTVRNSDISEGLVGYEPRSLESGRDVAIFDMQTRENRVFTEPNDQYLIDMDVSDFGKWAVIGKSTDDDFFIEQFVALNLDTSETKNIPASDSARYIKIAGRYVSWDQNGLMHVFDLGDENLRTYPSGHSADIDGNDIVYAVPNGNYQYTIKHHDISRNVTRDTGLTIRVDEDSSLSSRKILSVDNGYIAYQSGTSGGINGIDIYIAKLDGSFSKRYPMSYDQIAPIISENRIMTMEKNPQGKYGLHVMVLDLPVISGNGGPDDKPNSYITAPELLPYAAIGVLGIGAAGGVAAYRRKKKGRRPTTI